MCLAQFSINLASVALLSVWEKYRHLSLMLTPEDSQLPMSIQAFETMQRENMEKVRDVLVQQYAISEL